MLNLSSSTLSVAKQTLCLDGGLFYLSKLPARKLAIFVSKRGYKNYLAIEKLVNNKKKFDTKVFHPKWKSEPKLSEIKKNLKELLDFSPDWIAAIGGGSIIDGAKIAWALYENPNFDENFLSINFALPSLRKKARFIAVPTTAGSGSESSSSAILTSEDNEIKIPVVSNDFLPDLSILDESLLKGIPLKIIVPTMLDALSHCLEGYTSKIQNIIANNLASLSLLNIYKAFNKLKDGKNYENDALLGAYYAGIIQNTNVVGPAHALAHNLPFFSHSIATGFLLPSVVKLNSYKDSNLKKDYDLLAKNIGEKSIEHIIDNIYGKILPKMGIVPKLSKHSGINLDNFEKYAKLATNDNLCRYFPVDYSINDFTHILEESY